MISDDATMPMGVDSIFVPPDGAMQFAFYPQFAEREGVDFTWVLPIEGVLCPDGHKSFRDCRDPNGELLCECGGRVIE